MLPISYGKKTTSRYSINTGTMTRSEETSTAYGRQTEELDRRRHFGYLPKESIKTEDKES